MKKAEWFHSRNWLGTLLWIRMRKEDENVQEWNPKMKKRCSAAQEKNPKGG
jgi:hypothetical protein